MVNLARLAVEEIWDPSTQAVENIIAWQRARDTFGFHALTDTIIEPPAQCKPEAKYHCHAGPKKRDVGNRSATV